MSAPRYLSVRQHHLEGPWVIDYAGDSLVDALNTKSVYGGTVYEPLGITAAEKVAAEKGFDLTADNAFYVGCKECEKEGEVWENCYARPIRVKCEDCKGKGYVPTDLGQYLLTFVQMFVRVSTEME